MSIMTSPVYRRPLVDPRDALFMRCLTGATILGGLAVIALLLAPLRHVAITRVDQLPAGFARLILQPAPARPVLPPGLVVRPVPSRMITPGGGGGGGASLIPTAHPAPPEGLPPAHVARGPVTMLAPGAGQSGRERAQSDVRAALSASGSTAASALEGLSSSLRAASAADSREASSIAVPGPGGRGRAHVVRSARSDDQVGSGGDGAGVATSTADLGNSVVVGSLVGIGGPPGSRGGTGGGIGTGTGTGYGSGTGAGSGSGSGGGSGSGAGSGTGSGRGAGSAPGVYRSNASLLAVIQRYSAGIQYCYGNELKRNASLRGKLVVALTITASGDVAEVTVLQNTVGSQRLAECALSQIRDWKFPPIPEGVTTFQAPFVFTPPS